MSEQKNSTYKPGENQSRGFNETMNADAEYQRQAHQLRMEMEAIRANPMMMITPTPEGEKKMALKPFDVPSPDVQKRLNAATQAEVDRRAEREIRKLEGKGFKLRHVVTKPLAWGWWSYTLAARLAPVAFAGWWAWTQR